MEAAEAEEVHGRAFSAQHSDLRGARGGGSRAAQEQQAGQAAQQLFPLNTPTTEEDDEAAVEAAAQEQQEGQASQEQEQAEDEEPFILRVKILDGEKVINLDVQPATTVANIKAMVQDKEGIPIADQDLSKMGIGGWLQDDRTLSSYGFRDDSCEALCVKDGIRVP